VFVLLLGRPGLKFRGHCPQSRSDPEIKGGSRHGNENLSLLTQYAPLIMDEFLERALFQVNDIAPIPFQNYLEMTTNPVENGTLESGIVTTTESERCQKRICPSPEDGGPSWRMCEGAPKAPAPRPPGPFRIRQVRVQSYGALDLATSEAELHQ
jgi:hypothetical protein